MDVEAYMSMKIMLYELFRKFVSSLFESFSLNVDEKVFSLHTDVRQLSGRSRICLGTFLNASCS